MNVSYRTGRKRDRVLEMWATDLHHIRPLRGLRGDRVAKLFQLGIVRVVAIVYAAMCVAVGKVSFDDWFPVVADVEHERSLPKQLAVSVAAQKKYPARVDRRRVVVRSGT